MNALDQIVNSINKDYKSSIIQVGAAQAYVEKIQFSSPRVNFMTYGGIPVGKATEFFGPEGGGKTTAAMDVVGQAQKKAKREWDAEYAEVSAELETLLEKNNKSDKDRIKKLTAHQAQLEEDGPRKAVYVDAENTLDTDWAEKNGVDVDALYLVRPDDQTAEQVLQLIIDLIKSNQVCILVLDSVPMLVSQQLYDETLEKKSYGGIAAPLTEFSKRVSPLLSKAHTALVLINQVREDFDNPYNQYQTPGGKALKHLFALRIFCRKGTYLDHNNAEVPNSKAVNPHGNKAELKIVKTKVCKPDRLTGFHTINYAKGIDVLNDTIELAIEFNFIAKAGAWFTFLEPDGSGEIMDNGEGSPLKFQGRASVVNYLEDDVELFEELYEAVNLMIMNDGAPTEEEKTAKKADELDGNWAISK